MDSDDLAPVVPLRSEEEELVLLEAAVLDELEDEDERHVGAGVDEASNVEWLARHDRPRSASSRPRPNPPNG